MSVVIEAVKQIRPGVAASRCNASQLQLFLVILIILLIFNLIFLIMIVFIVRRK